MTSYGAASSASTRQILELSGKVVRHLPEMDSGTAQWLIENELRLKDFLQGLVVLPRKDLSSTFTISAFTIFKTITLGQLKDPASYRKVLQALGYRISSYASELLEKVTVAEAETDVDLVVVSVAELGFQSGATQKDIYPKAQELGLTLCPAEVGPALRLVYPNQPEREWLTIAMEPISASDGPLRVFRVGRDGNGLWLDSRHGHSGGFWDGRDRFAFTLCT